MHRNSTSSWRTKNKQITEIPSLTKKNREDSLSPKCTLSQKLHIPNYPEISILSPHSPSLLIGATSSGSVLELSVGQASVVRLKYEIYFQEAQVLGFCGHPSSNSSVFHLSNNQIVNSQDGFITSRGITELDAFEMKEWRGRTVKQHPLKIYFAVFAGAARILIGYVSGERTEIIVPIGKSIIAEFEVFQSDHIGVLLKDKGDFLIYYIDQSKEYFLKRRLVLFEGAHIFTSIAPPNEYVFIGGESSSIIYFTGLDQQLERSISTDLFNKIKGLSSFMLGNKTPILLVQYGTENDKIAVFWEKIEDEGFEFILNISDYFLGFAPPKMKYFDITHGIWGQDDGEFFYWNSTQGLLRGRIEMVRQERDFAIIHREYQARLNEPQFEDEVLAITQKFGDDNYVLNYTG